jgi:hypothetical protein
VSQLGEAAVVMFRDRADAGLRLAAKLQFLRGGEPVVVLGHCAVRAAATVAAGLGGLTVLRFVLPASTPRIRARGKAGPGSVAALEKIRIGGSDQWVLERSEDTCNQVALFLHGGPGHRS